MEDVSIRNLWQGNFSKYPQDIRSDDLLIWNRLDSYLFCNGIEPYVRYIFPDGFAH